ncbi:MAG: hypothetical protein IJU52_07400 [Clostridia bacterium]|nr:hypothetical protein [Clostridia bacterium]
MKRILALVLTAIMIGSAILLTACSGNSTPTPTPTPSKGAETTTAAQPTPSNDPSTKETAAPTTDTPDPTVAPTTPTEKETEAPGPYTDVPEFFGSVKRPYVKTEHTEAEELPTHASLVGDFLPAPTERSSDNYADDIDNGKDIINPASDAVTYMQYTNAVARYATNKDPSLVWKPATDFSSCFSAKYTGQYARSLQATYDILRDNGCLTIAKDDYARSALKIPVVKKNNVYQTQTTGWKVDKGIGEEALKYRLIQYEYINTSNRDNTVVTTGYYDPKTGGIEITESENGQKLLKKIKDAIVTGNVVVAQGIIQGWQEETLPADTGSDGKAGDTVIAFALELSDSYTKTAYQVCIVGYDDEISFESHGVTTTGAFLVCNAGNKKWGKDGFAWVMYDSLNTFNPQKNEEGESAFVLDDPEKDKRGVVFDVFSFIYWDRDITDQKPQLYAEVELETANRGAFSIEMTKTDAFGRTSRIEAYQTYHVHWNGFATYGLNSKNNDKTVDKASNYEFFNPTGTKNGKAVDGYYTISFERLLTGLPEGTSYEDFDYTVRVVSRDLKNPVTVKSIVIKNSNGEVVRTFTMPKGESVAESEVWYSFNFGKTAAKDVIIGTFYTFTNVKTGKFMINDRGMLLKTGDTNKSKEAYKFYITYSTALDRYKLWLKESTDKYTKVLDVTKGQFNDGNTAQFNAESAGSIDNPGSCFATQFWGISYNEDGTVSFYLRSPEGKYFALAVNDEDKIVIKEVGSELTDAMKWNIVPEFTEVNPITAKAEATADGIAVSGTLTTKKITEITVTVTKLGAKEPIVTQTVTPENKAYSVTLPAITEAGDYLIAFQHVTVDADGVSKTLHTANTIIYTVG